MASERPVSLYQHEEAEAISLDSSFKFHCHEGLDCFNQCCRAPTIVLSPYDILRLKRCLGLTSGGFLRRYTLTATEEQSNLPLVFIDAYRTLEGGCPFRGANGCRVYASRPAACRLFPITMGSQLTEDGVKDYYFCRRLDYCRGFTGEAEWTVASWQADQGFVEFDRGRREWLEILLRSGLQRPLRAEVRNQVAIAAYDLDEFRRTLQEPDFLEANDLDEQALVELRNDDLALLKFAYRYLKALLFKEG